MNLVQRVGHWGDTHHPLWLDIVRILLGAFLCYKGIEFLMNMGQMLNLITNRMSFGSFTAVLMSNYISFAHLLGGILLIMGALTRFACLLNIPILLGAVFFVNTTLYRPFSEVLVSILILLMLILFLIVGNGKIQMLTFREEKQ